MSLSIKLIDYQNPEQAQDLVYLLNGYAKDPMGGGAPLSNYTQKNLASKLAKIPHAASFIAYYDDKPASLVNCFFGFSTFACKPLINIHDLVVHQDFRGKGIAKKMLEAVKQHAMEQGCCKVTLEVLFNNHIARQAYEKFGFVQYQLEESAGTAVFMELKL